VLLRAALGYFVAGCSRRDGYLAEDMPGIRPSTTPKLCTLRSGVVLYRRGACDASAMVVSSARALRRGGYAEGSEISLRRTVHYITTASCRRINYERGILHTVCLVKTPFCTPSATGLVQQQQPRLIDNSQHRIRRMPHGLPHQRQRIALRLLYLDDAVLHVGGNDTLLLLLLRRRRKASPV
jgi:hypothetical protein